MVWLKVHLVFTVLSWHHLTSARYWVGRNSSATLGCWDDPFHLPLHSSLQRSGCPRTCSDRSVTARQGDVSC